MLTVDLTTPESVRSRATLEFSVKPPPRPKLGKRIRIALEQNPIIAPAIVFSKRKRDPLFDAGRPAPFNPQTIVGPAVTQLPDQPAGLRVQVVWTPGDSYVPDGVLRDFPITIGRERCDLSFPDDKKVSRNHVHIFVRDDRIWLEDIGSLNGTFVGDVRLGVSAPVPLDRITRVRLGLNTVLELEFES